MTTKVLAAALGLIVAALVSAAGAAALAEPVTTRAGLHDGFGRIALDWSRPVEFEARIEDDTLLVSFPRALETDLSPVQDRLEAYVEAAHVGADGRSLAFRLARPLEFKSFLHGNTVVLDLAEFSPAAGNADQPVIVRRGEHAGFSRIVFDWPLFVDYRVRRNGERIVVLFSRPSEIDLSHLTAALPRLVLWAQSDRDRSSSTVTLGLAAGARARNFRLGNRIVIDVLAAAGGQSVARAAAVRHVLPRRRAALPPVPDIPAPPPAADEDSVSAPLPVPALKGPRDLLAPARPSRDEGDGAEAAAGRSRGEGLAVDVLPTLTGTRLRFAWPLPVAAAVFQRSGHLWVVFDRHAAADLSPLTSDAAGPVITAEQMPGAHVTLLRLRLEEGLFPVVRRHDTAWFVDLGERAAGAANVIAVRPEPHAAMGPRLFLPAIDLGEPLSVADPEAGDRLMVVPAHAPVRGVAVERDFLEAKVLATAHGVAVVPEADGVAVRALRNGVVVTKNEGLLLSDGAGSSRASSSRVAGGAERRVFHFAEWRRGSPERFLETKQELFRDIAAVPVTERNDRRLKLAQFYFAHGFAADAKGILATIEQDDPRALSDPGSRALRGALNFLLNRFDKAAEDLYRPEFDGNREIAQWRGAVAASQGDLRRAERAFAIAAGGAKSYPKDLRIRFLLLDARTALGLNNVTRLDSALAQLSALHPPEGVLSEVVYLRGRAHERLGQSDSALESYQRAITSAHRPIRARAELARVNLLLKKGELSEQQAIDRLDGLRFVWRGDDFELSVLRQLGQLYAGKGKYRAALDTFRRAVTHFPKDATTRAVAQAMSGLFERLFLEGGADAMTPVAALGLYYEFRELTPLGPKGDEMIRKLADRLVAVDLLERAAELLEHQVKYRLEGGEKARVGARLAVIYLLDKRPKEALRALSETRRKALGPRLAGERRRLEARGLADLERYGEALALLEGDAGPAAGVLRAEVHWRARNWEQAADALEALLGARWQRSEGLGPLERQQVMRLAVSRSLAGDQAGLDRVRERYAPSLADGADADAFRVITARVDRRATAFRQLAGRIADLGNLQAFMASYREKLAKGGLSAIN